MKSLFPNNLLHCSSKQNVSDLEAGVCKSAVLPDDFSILVPLHSLLCVWKHGVVFLCLLEKTRTTFSLEIKEHVV